MPSPGHGQGSNDTSLAPPSVKALGSYARASAKRPCEDSDPESDSETKDNNIADMEQMDFQHSENITATQAIGDVDDNPGHGIPQLPPPLSAEHAALRSDFEIITLATTERLYSRIIADLQQSATDTAKAFQKTTDQLHNQIASMGIRITQLQQQILTYQDSTQSSKATPIPATTKKVLKMSLSEKKNTGKEMARTTTTLADGAAPLVTSATLQTPPTNPRRWETVQHGTQKTKISTPKVTTPKLISTKYPQAEREVTCHFLDVINTNDGATRPEKTYTERQGLADIALRRVNSALVNNKDVLVPPFIRARVTIRGSIIFTTSNIQNNVVYEDYTTIIAEALSYYGKSANVEIGKRFSQFLLHGVPTHLSLPEISDSITTNYP
ncbi:MAG: hypothetical protein QOH03_5448, partial [Kribbellaceae bacterium]|nr:hypothetical protein [Kribbellaceae bacterium]